MGWFMQDENTPSNKSGEELVMSSYSIPDLFKLLQNERNGRLLLRVGFPPALVIKGELHAIEGLPLVEDAAEEIIRSVASTREVRTFRESGIVDVIVAFEGSYLLFRAVRAFGEFRLELQSIVV